jgi:hypothetical protein
MEFEAKDTPMTSFDSERHRPEDDLEFATAADKTAYWFAAAVLFAFLAAGIIVYRAANPELQMASSDIRAPAVAAKANPIPFLPPAHAHVEGIDP